MAVNYTDASLTESVLVTDSPTYGQTVTGYGGKIPTRYMLKYAGRMRRVYAMAYGNSASVYIVVNGEDLFLDLTTQERIERLSK